MVPVASPLEVDELLLNTVAQHSGIALRNAEVTHAALAVRARASASSAGVTACAEWRSGVRGTSFATWK